MVVTRRSTAAIVARTANLALRAVDDALGTSPRQSPPYVSVVGHRRCGCLRALLKACMAFDQGSRRFSANVVTVRSFDAPPCVPVIDVPSSATS